MNKFVITLIFIAFSLLSCSNNDFDESECIEFNLKYIKLYELAERDAEQTRYEDTRGKGKTCKWMF